MSSLQPTECVTGAVRLSFCHLFEKWGDEKSGGPKYSATLLIPKSDAATISQLFAAYDEAVKEGVAPNGKWNGQVPMGVESRVYNGMGISSTPIYDGDGVRPTGETFGIEARGCLVLTASDKSKRPDLVDVSGAQIPSAFDLMGKPTIYSGCYGRVYIAFFAYNHNGKKGIGCALRAVQKTGEGEPLASQRLSSEEAFGMPPAKPMPQQGMYAPQAAYGQPAPYAPQQGYSQPAPYAPAAPQQGMYAQPAMQAPYAPPPPAYAAPQGYGQLAPQQAAYATQQGYAPPQEQAPAGYVNPITGGIR